MKDCWFFQKIFNFFLTAAIGAVAVVAFVAFLCATVPLPVLLPSSETASALPDAPIQIDIEGVQDASSADWDRFMGGVETIALTNRPISVSLQSWDFCSECDIPVPTVTDPVTVEVPVATLVTVTERITVELPINDLCKEFQLTGPSEVTAGEDFTVTALLPTGFVGKLTVVGYNLDTPTLIQRVRGEETAQFSLRAPQQTGLPEIWLPVVATLFDENGRAICQSFTLVRDP